MSALSDALNEANRENWSAAEIARRSGDLIHRATAANVMRGKHAANPSEEVLRAFALVFPSLSMKELRKLAGQHEGEYEPYIPPPEASRLNARQRKAIDELIRSMAGEDSVMRQALEFLDRHDPASVSAFLHLGPEAFIAWAVERERQSRGPTWTEPQVEKVLEAHRRATGEEMQLAARRGTPTLRSVKKQQDEAGEAPDPDGPDGGA